jgi:hypothetical protein
VGTKIRCGSDVRRQAVKSSTTTNGIDYLELFESKSMNSIYRPLLIVYCFKKAGLSNLREENVLVEGGVRLQNIKIQWVRPANTIINDIAHSNNNEITKDLSSEEKEILKEVGKASDSSLAIVIRPNSSGDFSTYALRLVRNSGQSGLPPENFDNILSRVNFSFKIGCPVDFDCSPDDICYPKSMEKEPVIDYLAKDFASFRRMMLNHLSTTIHNWEERNVADFGIMLIESLSYLGDHLSYYQDAVATEAYLGTARKRISVRRHARLLDYFMDEGCNARSFVCLEIDKTADGLVINPKTKLLTRGVEFDPYGILIPQHKLEEQVNNGAEVFQTMHKATLYSSNNEILFYTWGDSECCLPEGATSATIRNDDNKFDILIFSWEHLIRSPPEEADLVRLKNYLNENFGLGWLESQKEVDFLMISDSLIKVSVGRNHLYIRINDERNLAIISIDSEGNSKICEFQVRQENGEFNAYGINLRVGDLLIFEEIRSPTTFKPEDTDRTHRHVVRLTKIARNFDELFGLSLIDIIWKEEDALPFQLCLEIVDNSGTRSNEADEENRNGKNSIIVSVARGNVVLAEHGNTVVNSIDPLLIQKNYPLISSAGIVGEDEDDDFGTISTPINHNPGANNDNSAIIFATEFLGYSLPSTIGKSKFRPRLSKRPLTFKGPFDQTLPASKMLTYDIRQARPDIILTGEGKTWTPVYDLLESGELDNNFVVEIENDGTAIIRFVELGKVGAVVEGNDEINDNNMNIDTPSPFYATYSIGNGTRGNVGPESITRILADGQEANFQLIRKIRNPIPAEGGTDPEDIDHVRQSASHAFRVQGRAVTREDYIEILKRHPEVQNASAIMLFTGSWYTVFISVDRFGGKVVDSEFKKEIRNFLNNYRLAGYDLEITESVYVPLSIRLNICLEEDYFASDIRQRLEEVFSARYLANGDRGFFHHDNLTFGQPVLLSRIYETALTVDGVSSCVVTRFQRWGETSTGEIERGMIEMTYYEIARLDNDRNFPENGMIEFTFGGPVIPLKKLGILKL